MSNLKIQRPLGSPDLFPTPMSACVVSLSQKKLRWREQPTVVLCMWVYMWTIRPRTERKSRRKGRPKRKTEGQSWRRCTAPHPTSAWPRRCCGLSQWWPWKNAIKDNQ